MNQYINTKLFVIQVTESAKKKKKKKKVKDSNGASEWTLGLMEYQTGRSDVCRTV